MNLSFLSLQEFADELAYLRENITLPVRFRREEEFLNEAITKVGARASAIGQLGNDQVLLEWSDWLGQDIHGSDAGSEQARQAEEFLAGVCAELGMQLRPGRIEL